jgi:hypothetical protein
VHVRLPGLTVELKARIHLLGEGQEAAKVVPEDLTPAFFGKQGMRCKLANLDASVEDDVGLEAGVGEEEIPGELGKRISIACHASRFLAVK